MGNETGGAEVTGGGVMTPSSSLDVLSEAPTHADADTAVPEGDAAEARAAVSATNVPTVLSKLQKWGDYASYGEPVAPSRFIPMKTPLSPSLLQVRTKPCGRNYERFTLTLEP
jgi:mRNA-capping enzyme